MEWRSVRILLAILVLAGSGLAGAYELSGMVAFDSQQFLGPPAFSQQRSATYYPSLMMQPELRVGWNGEKDRFTLVPFFRLEPTDPQRQHGDIRELNWMHTGDGWDLTVGAAKVFWGVTESRHLVDIINQTDLIEDIDQKEKLGQPMVKLDFIKDYGNFSFFVLPAFRERTYENARGRLRFQLPIDPDRANYQSSLNVWHPDLSARWSHSLGSWDIGISHFWGTSRESAFNLDLSNPLNPMLIPSYNIINQTGLDVQRTSGPWLLKLEAITRSGQGKRFGAVTTGFEYTLFNVMKSGADLGLLFEYNYDGRDQRPTVAPPTLYGSDLFFGYRLGLNDTQNTSLLGGVLQDLEKGATFINVEASRRFADAWTVELKSRFFMDAPPSNFVFYGYHQDSYVQLRIARHF